MLSNFAARATKKTLPIVPVTTRTLKKLLAGRTKTTQNWVKATGFTAKPGEVALVPARDGTLKMVLFGATKGPWSWASLPGKLPRGRYRIDADLSSADANDAALGWALTAYDFSRYRKPKKKKGAVLVWPESCDRGYVTRITRGLFLTRDLINTPAEDMGPTELAEAAKVVADEHGAEFGVIVGQQLLDENYPAIHAVGRAADDEPRLIDFTWGDPSHKKLTLVGKGVCFDTGGLDLKPAASMRLMKKDMGGAATVLGLAHAIMDAKLPVRLRVLIPAVENSVAGNAFRPLDVLSTRKGLTVEVGNTDAEGRLVLCDALAEAATEEPDLLIDIATLTGAARVALGTDLPALFSNRDTAAGPLLEAGVDLGDPMWRMPLYRPYRSHLKSPIADLNNVSSTRFGGAITAALFLSEFVPPATPWIHIDTLAYRYESRPGRPSGGEGLGIRSLYTMLDRRYRPAPETSADDA